MKIKKFISKCEGSATLELTIVIPFILTILMTILFFLLFVYQKLVCLDVAVYAAKERAATWDNSFRALETGSVGDQAKNDGLYWRILDDYKGSRLVSLKEKNADEFGQTRLGFSLLNSPEQGAITTNYKNSVVKRTVSVDVQRGYRSPYPGLTGLLGTGTNHGASAEVVEPVEFIRTYDLGDEYFGELSGYLKEFGQDVIPQQETQVIVSVESDVLGQRVYHFPGCRYITRIKKENIKVFNNEQEAVSSGYHLCIECAKKIVPQK